MEKSAFNYVRTYRQRHALSEDTLARLINQQSRSAISRFESGERLPTLEGALALQVVFGQTPDHLFPGFFEKVEKAVMRRADRLYARLEGRPDRACIAQRALVAHYHFGATRLFDDLRDAA